MLLKYGSPHAETLAVERIWLTPWFLELEGLQVAAQGVKADVANAELRFCLTSLITRTLDVVAFNATGVVADMREFQAPPAAEKKPFPGVLASLDTPVRIRIRAAHLQGEVLSPFGSLTLDVAINNVAPGASGSVVLNTEFQPQGTTDLIALAGEIALEQAQKGRFTRVDAALHSDLALASLPQPEQLSLSALVARDLPEPPSDDDVEPAAIPETVRVTLERRDENGERAAIRVDGLFDAPAGSLNGRYELLANDRLLLPYLAGKPTPSLDLRTSGELALQINDGRVTTNLDSDLHIEEMDLVLGGRAPTEYFDFHSTAAVMVGGEDVEISRFESTLNDAAGNTVLTASLSDAVKIVFDNPQATLANPRAWLDLRITRMPLNWLETFLPDYRFEGAQLAGEFTLANESETDFVLKPTAPLQFDGLDIAQGETVLAENIAVRTSPTLRYSSESVNVDVDQLQIKLGEAELANINAQAQQARVGEAPPLALTMHGSLQLDPLMQLPIVAEKTAAYPVPKTLGVDVDTALTLATNTINFSALQTTVAQRGKAPLLEATLRQAFSVAQAEDGAQIHNPQGELVEVKTANIDLAWLSPLLSDVDLAGRLEHAAFSLKAKDAETFVLTPVAPVQLKNVNVRLKDEPAVKRLNLSIRPTITYSPKNLDVQYRDLDLRDGRTRLLSGDGSLRMPLANQAGAAAKNTGDNFQIGGHTRINLTALARQPIVTRSLDRAPPKTPLSGELRYQLASDGVKTRFDELNATFKLNKDTRFSVAGERGFTLRTTIGKGENLAQHAIGRLKLDIDNLSSQALAEFLPNDRVAFSTINAQLDLASDGRSLKASSRTPLEIANVALSGENGAFLHAFTLSADAKVTTRGGLLDAELGDATLSFTREPDRPALRGSLALSLDPARTVKLRTLSAHLDGDLPLLLDQPLVLPNHTLSTGHVQTHIEVIPSGEIGALTLLDGLKSDAPLAMERVHMPVVGEVNPDGSGFNFKMPITVSGKSGESVAMLTAAYQAQQDAQALIAFDFSSSLFYLNDLLAAIDGISREAPAEQDKPAQNAPTDEHSIDNTPDETAAWDVLPYDTVIRFNIAKLFYTDYLAFDNVQGEIATEPQRLALRRLGAHFHDSPLELDGDLKFVPESTTPYDLVLTGNVTEFDLNQFFSELVPGEKPRVEGLFSVALKAAGRAPNLPEYRNRILLDVKLNSRDGLFRPLPPDSALIGGTSNVLGIVGEGLSYLPTGGFGAGAVSRLVDYIQEIDYDRIDIHVTRDETQDLTIQQALVRSPTIRLVANGGVDYVPGTDILDSPLTLNAQLNMLGKGAAILYSINLLQDQEDPKGYIKGPEFKIWGTPSAMESNFAEIIQQAGDGALKGGITRPISGLIGNIKYRWFGSQASADTDDGKETTNKATDPSPAPEAVPSN